MKKDFNTYTEKSRIGIGHLRPDQFLDHLAVIIIKLLKFHLVIDCIFFYMNNWRCFVLKPTSSKGAPEQRTNRVIHLVHLIRPHTIWNVQVVQVGTQTNRDNSIEPASHCTEHTNKQTEMIQSSYPPIMRKNQRRCYGLLHED